MNSTPHTDLELLKSQIEALQRRNARVDLDKAWETSWCRRLSVAGITYAVTTIVFWLLSAPTPWLSACIPTVGYLLSTFSLPILRQQWMKRQNGR